MPHSIVTGKGRTTIPGKVRKALQIKPGDTLEYVIEGDHATIRIRPGLRSLKGALASNKGKQVPFAQIRRGDCRVSLPGDLALIRSRRGTVIRASAS